MHKIKDLKKILVIQIRALGDVILTTPVFSLIKKYYPEARLEFLTGKGIKPLLAGLRDLDDVLEYPYSPGHLPGVFQFTPEIRRRRYDLIIDYQATPGTALLSYFSGAPHRLGWANSRRRWAYSLTSDANEIDEYVPLQKSGMLHAIGIPEKSQHTRVSFTTEDLRTALNFLDAQGVFADQLKISLSAKSKRQARQYFPDRTAVLQMQLVQRFGARVFFNQAPGEEEYVANVAALCKTKPIVLPVWPLPVFAAFLSLMDVHLAYDNGAIHVARAVGTDTLALFGATNPVHWCPPNDPQHRFIASDVPCRFCGLRSCGLMICMEQLSPQQIIEELLKLPAFREKSTAGLRP